MIGVQAYLAGRHPFASATPYGMGCPGTAGMVPSLTTTGCPGAGFSFDIGIEGALAAAPAAIQFGGGRTSVPIGGCSLLVSPLLFAAPGLTDATGAFGLTLPIPLGGSTFMITAQGFVIDSAASPLGVAFTNGVELDVF